MTSPWLDRWRSERFAELVDANDASPRRHRRSSSETELAELAALTRGLGHLTVAPEPDPEFRSTLRSFLMATAEREGIGATATAEPAKTPVDALTGKTQVVKQVRPRGSTSGRTRVALLAGATIGALVLSGVSLASTDSLPGEALYQVKLSTERAQLAMAGSDLSRGQLYLEFAAARLGEASQVDASQLASALNEMDRETIEGVKLLTSAAARGETAALDTLTAFLKAQTTTLTDLQQARPGDGATARSLTLLDRIRVRVTDLTVALARPCPNPSTDSLGVDPTSC